jgi:hypothetical protein
VRCFTKRARLRFADRRDADGETLGHFADAEHSDEAEVETRSADCGAPTKLAAL